MNSRHRVNSNVGVASQKAWGVTGVNGYRNGSATAPHCLGRKRFAFWFDMPPEELADFFELIETEYGLDVGLLRPEDNLARFTTPIRTKNPLRWWAVEVGLEDSASELNYQIVQRADQFGLAQYLPVHTVGAYVRVWCGRVP